MLAGAALLGLAAQHLPLGAQQPVPLTPPLPMELETLSPPAEHLRPEHTPWTLADVEALALRNNPTLAQAQARIAAAEGTWVQTGLYPNPDIGYAASEVGNEGRAGQQGFYIGQEIVTGHKLRWNRTVADAEIRRMQQEYRAQEGRVLNDARVFFYDTLVAQHAVTLATELVRIGEAGSKTTEDLFKGLEVNRSDVLQAQIEAHNARLVLVTAQNNHLSAWRRLTAVLNLPPQTVQPLAGELEMAGQPLSWEQALAHLEGASPELASAAANLERARAVLCQQVAYSKPNVSFQGTLQHDNATSYDVAGIQLTVPLQVYNYNQGNISRARAELIEAEREVERVALRLRDRLAEAFRGYELARQQLEIYDREILPRAKQALDLTTTTFRAGEVSYLILLTAQRTYFQTTMQRLEALRQVRSAEVEINGLLLRGGLGQ